MCAVLWATANRGPTFYSFVTVFFFVFFCPHVSNLGLDQEYPNSVPEGHCPIGFSSNLPQHTCLEVSSMPSKTLAVSEIAPYTLK